MVTVNPPTQAAVTQTPIPSNCSTSGALNICRTVHIGLIKAYCCNNAIISDPNSSSPEEISNAHAASAVVS